MTADQRQGRISDAGQTVEELPAPPDQFDAFFRRIELAEFLDVGTGNESG